MTTDPRTTTTRDAHVLLTDGSIAVVRPVRPSDRPALETLHRSASPTSLRFRFFVVGTHAAQEYVEHLFASDPEHTIALVAEQDGQLVALATAEVTSPDSAEVAFMVADAFRGRGLGSLLLEHLAATARDRGIRHLTAEVLAENTAMVGVFRDAGFEIVRRLEGGIVEVALETTATARALAAADDREAVAEAHSLAPLLYPHSVAVVGARRDGTGIGGAVVRSVRDGGFNGALHVVHPQAAQVLGIPTYPRLRDVPTPVDLAVLCVPAVGLLAALDDAAAANVPAVVIVSSGLSDLGAEGRAIEHELVRKARLHGIRLVGPNCLGVLSNRPDIRLNATFARSTPPSGGLAIASQSGGIGIALIDLATQLGLGVHSLVSLGNKADVSSNDLLMAWLHDPAVTAASLYLESFGNALKFARVARTFASAKPLLAVVGGRSNGGRRAGASHTAAAASPAVGVDALFAQAGVISCDSAEDMARTAILLSEQPLPAGNRVGIISNAGGFGVLGADACEAAGLVVPELSPDLRAAVAEHVLATTGTSNPVDLGAGATPAALSGAVQTLLASDEIDSLLMVLVGTAVADPGPSVAALLEARATDLAKPALLVTMGGVQAPGSGSGWTTYPTVAEAVSSLGRTTRYAEWRRVPSDVPEPEDPLRSRPARLGAQALLRNQQAGWLAPDRVGDVLSTYGLTPTGQVVEGPAAAAAASRMGFPVALKVADPTVVHKTDRGLVRTSLGTAEEVRAAVESFAAELGSPSVRDVPVLVQPMVGGVEIALGVVRDPGFGPLVMIAAGGVATDLHDDRVFLLPPLTRGDAQRALRSLRLWPLLEGYRGAARADIAGLEDLVLDVGRLAAEVPEVAELDLNPVIAGPDRIALVDVKLRIAPAPETDAGVPRRLRPLV